jgi:signal recognition particle GTPase
MFELVTAWARMDATISHLVAETFGLALDEGSILIIARNHRTQERNRQEAHDRLAELIRQALVEPKVRKPTKPTRSSKEKRLAGKVKQGRGLSLEDYREQLRQLVTMGGLEQLIDKLPGLKPEQLAATKFDPKLFRRQIGIIDSMTPAERRQPDLIDGSRKRRIAAGAGLPIQDVSRLLKQHKQLTKTMKQLSKGGGMQRLLGAMRKGGGPPMFRGRR